MEPHHSSKLMVTPMPLVTNHVPVVSPGMVIVLYSQVVGLLTVKLTGCPCVSVMGLVAGLVDSVRDVVGLVKLDFQLLTKFATLTEPNPVAKSYPVVVA